MKLTGGLGSTDMGLIIWVWGNVTTLFTGLTGYVTTFCWIPDTIKLLGGVACPTLASIKEVILPEGWPIVWKLVREFWVGFGLLFEIKTG